MSKQSDIARDMYAKGYTYEQIAEYLGVTVKQARNLQQGAGFRVDLVAKVKYAGLRNWMLENRISIHELKNRGGMTGLYRPLIGDCDPSKCTIDSILRVTGMTYEECFGVEDGGMQ